LQNLTGPNHIIPKIVHVATSTKLKIFWDECPHH